MVVLLPTHNVQESFFAIIFYIFQVISSWLDGQKIYLKILDTCMAFFSKKKNLNIFVRLVHLTGKGTLDMIFMIHWGKTCKKWKKTKSTQLSFYNTFFSSSEAILTFYQSINNSKYTCMWWFIYSNVSEKISDPSESLV